MPPIITSENAPTEGKPLEFDLSFEDDVVFCTDGQIDICDLGVFQPEDDFPDADEDVQNANHCISCNELASWGRQ